MANEGIELHLMLFHNAEGVLQAEVGFNPQEAEARFSRNFRGFTLISKGTLSLTKRSKIRGLFFLYSSNDEILDKARAVLNQLLSMVHSINENHRK